MPTMAGYGNAMVNVATSQKNHTLNGRGLTFRETYDIEPIPTLNEHKKAMCSLSMLSILRPTNSECDVDPEEAEVEAEEEIPEERPVTPINDTIVQPPKTYSVLCKHIRRRIHPRPYWPHISEHNQRSLGAVILAEVNAKWPLLRKQAKCPFLTDAQNRELQRRITVHIVIVCEQLFLFYCNQIKVLNNRAVFSEAANLTRIHGQLTLDADKYLNILAVRRHIIADLRKSEGDVGKLLSGSAEDVISRKDDRASPVFPVSPTMLSALSFRKMIAKSRTKTKKESDYDVHRELYDMHKQMPVLNTNKVAQLQTIVRRLEETRHVDEVASEHVPSLPSAEGEALDRDITPRFDKKWPSEPVLATVKLLDEEKVKSNRPTSREGDESPGGRGCVGDHRLTGPGRPATAAGDHVPSHVCKSHHTALAELAKKGGIREDDKAAAAPADEWAASINPSQDLVRLVEKQTIAKEKDPQIIALMESPDDIPPLLQAITRYGKQNDRHRKLLETERELDERKRMMDEEEMEPLPEPKFPQPPVVQFKLPGHCNPVDRTPMVVRSSDVHIPNKVELTKSSLSVYGPLFNDLTGDISPATVKALDANLFQGAELREVYDEIMKTVPNLHRQFDNDDLVVPPADDVDLNKILASSTLLRPKSQQIINRSLAKSGQAPPWGGEHPRESIADQRRRSRAGADTAMTMSRGDGGGSESLRVVSRLAPVADKSSREYASWLAWWKATITTDDYLKYLATQETDYLGVIFHFYDSEAAPSDTESTSKTHQLEMDRLRDQRIADIKAAKTERIEGMWNANSVMLGGLGKLPDIEDADLMADLGDVDLELAFERTSSAHTEDYRKVGAAEGNRQMLTDSILIENLKEANSGLEQHRTRSPSVPTDSDDRRAGVQAERVRSAPDSRGKVHRHRDSLPCESCKECRERGKDECGHLALIRPDSPDPTPGHTIPPSLRKSRSSSRHRKRSRPISRAVTRDEPDVTDSSTASVVDVTTTTPHDITTNHDVTKADEWDLICVATSAHHVVAMESDSILVGVATTVEDAAATSSESSVDAVEVRAFCPLSSSSESAIQMTSATSSDDSSDHDVTNAFRNTHGVVLCALAEDQQTSSGYGTVSGADSYHLKVSQPERRRKKSTTSVRPPSREVRLRPSTSLAVIGVGRPRTAASERPKVDKIDEHQTEEAEAEDVVIELSERPRPARLTRLSRSEPTCGYYCYKLLFEVESKAREVTEGTSATCATSEMSGEVTVKDVAQLQRRFEVVWKRLRTPLDQKVDLAMKYSSDQFMPLLAESVAAYERATGLILRREQIVRELDLFERQASDPGRFFAKGWKGSGLARLDEARTRSNIYKRLDRIESRIAPILAAVYRQFGDVVTYCGRPYDEKMSCDKVEMLYWLQQERRCRQLAIAGETLQWQMFFQDNHTDEKETADDNPGNVSAGEPLAPSNSRVISSARV